MRRVNWRAWDWVLIVAAVGVALLATAAAAVYPPAGIAVLGGALVIWAVFLAPPPKEEPKP